MTASDLKPGLIQTMAELLTFSHGLKKVHTRLVGYEPCPRIQGRRSEAIPDLFVPEGLTRPLMLDTITLRDFRDQDALFHRLFLLSAFCVSKGWTFQLACFSGMAAQVKLFCSRNEIRYAKLWEI